MSLSARACSRHDDEDIRPPWTGEQPEPQIDHLRTTEATEVTAVVRCIRGPVHHSAHFDHITAASVDLTLTGIFAFGRAIDSLDPVHTALVTLQEKGYTCSAPETPPAAGGGSTAASVVL